MIFFLAKSNCIYMSKNNRSDKEGMGISLLVLLLSIVLIVRLIGIYISEGVINTNYRDPQINTDYFRGTIYDRSGNILAMDRTSYFIEIEAERVSEVSRLAAIIAPYTDEDAVTIENEIRSSEFLSIPSNLLMAEEERFSEMLKKENLDHLVTIKEKKERIYPLSEHGRLLIGREGEASSISAEALYDDILKPELTLDAPVSSGKDITLSLSQRIEYIADHIVSSYVGERSDEYLMLAMLDYSTGEIYALSQNNPDDKAIDYYAIEQALSSRNYTILKHNGGIKIDTPDDFSGISTDRYIRVIYRSGFALVSSSSSKEMRDDALTEFETMLSL